MRKRFLFPALFGVIFGTTLFIFHQESGSGIVFNPEPGSDNRSNTRRLINRTPFTTGLESLPNSLQGIQVDGELQPDTAGNLILNSDVRRVFDFFLNAVGEEPKDQIIGRIKAYINWQLPDLAAEQASQALEEYLALREAMRDEPSNMKIDSFRFSDERELTSVTLRNNKQLILELRSHYLSPHVDRAFYEEEDLFDEYTLAKLALVENKELPSTEKAAAIAELEAALPEPIKQQIASVSRLQLLSQLKKGWKMEQGDAAALRQIRESVVGSAATDRLEKLDQQRSDWQSRVDAWMVMRGQILVEESLASQDRMVELDRARSEYFSSLELKRVQALEYLRDYTHGL